MNRKYLSLLVMGLLLFTLAFSACSGSKSSSFPVGKFIKSGETDYGMEFNSDGSFQVFKGETVYVRSAYKVDGNTITEISNDANCETNVSFKYVFDGKNLTFNYIGNPDDDVNCDGRHTDFNNVTYTLSK